MGQWAGGVQRLLRVEAFRQDCVHNEGNDMTNAGSNGAAAGAGAVYGLGIFGAVVYYIQTATSFFGGLIGFIKAFFWPGFMVYELMKFLKM